MTKLTDEMKIVRELEKKVARLDKAILKLLAAAPKSKVKKVAKKRSTKKSTVSV